MGVGLALVTAAVVRGFVLSHYYCITSDGVLYVHAAEGCFGGDTRSGLESLYPPGYALVRALFYPVVGDWELTGQIVWFFAGVQR